MSDNSNSSDQNANTALPASKTPQLQRSQDLALDALSSVDATSDGDEIAASDEVAESLQFLQNIIERNAQQLENLGQELKERREMLKNLFDNDSELSEAQEQADQLSQQVKVRKSAVRESAEAQVLKTQIGELNEQKNEIEETLSNHLINYYQMTNSTSFDTSDGDQWEFKIKARVKSRRNQG
ncbi:MAG: hypothetical protein WAU07_02715 [Microgenomates group bacterium]